MSWQLTSTLDADNSPLQR